jgi:hypothetical protein
LQPNSVLKRHLVQCRVFGRVRPGQAWRSWHSLCPSLERVRIGTLRTSQRSDGAIPGTRQKRSRNGSPRSTGPRCHSPILMATVVAVSPPWRLTAKGRAGSLARPLPLAPSSNREEPVAPARPVRLLTNPSSFRTPSAPEIKVVANRPPSVYLRGSAVLVRPWASSWELEPTRVVSS